MVDQGSGENKPWHLFSSEDLKTGGHRSNLKKKRRMISISPITGTSSDSFDVTPRCPLSCITNVGQSSSIDNSTGSKNGGHRSRGKKTTVTPLSEVSLVGDLSHTQRKNSSRLSRLSGTEARTNLFEDAFISPTGKEHDTRENAVSPDDMFTYEEDFSDDTDYICSDDYTLGEDYDWSDGSNDLKNLAKQKAYLADVVGIIKNHRGIEDIVNRHDKPQKQAKFTISDGSSNVNVTFWDNYGVQFEKDIAEVKEYPIIIIIAGCKVGMWNDSIDLGNSHDTQYYFNYKHPTVLTIRKMLAKPNFSQQMKVIVHVKINSVKETSKWFLNTCTTCNQVIERTDEFFICASCNRIVPHPDKKFSVKVEASDDTGSMKILLHDRQVRTIIGKRVYNILTKDEEKVTFPHQLKKIAKQNYTVMLLIRDINTKNKIDLYSATNICYGFKVEEEEEEENEAVEKMEITEDDATEATTSSCHLDKMSTQTTTI